MEVWVDADACPRVIKEILYRAAERVQVQVHLIANQPLAIPRSLYLRAVVVAAGPDEADRCIVEWMKPGDLVVTADIPLAALVVEKGGLGLNPRGETYTTENIQERLATRDLMDELRSSGVVTGGPAVMGASDKQEFANSLDRLLTRHVKTKEAGTSDGRPRDGDGRPAYDGPRDALGRPIPAPADAGLDPTPPIPTRLRGAVKLGASLFDQRRFFQAHEVFESLWRAESVSEEERPFWKAVTQVCVALCHFQRGNLSGYRSVLQRAMKTLDTFPEVVRGVDPQRLVRFGEVLAADPTAELPPLLGKR